MADELFDTLLRFHREVVQPELNEIRGEVRDMRGEIRDIRGDMQDMRIEMRDMRGDIDTMRDTMATRTELQAARDEMTTELQAIRGQMATRAELQDMRAELQAMRAEMVTWPVLMLFFEQMVKPEVETVRSEIGALATRTEMFSHVDGLYVVFKRLETEYYALMAAVGRLEKQMAEQIADRSEVRSELLGLKDQVSQLSDRIAGRDTN